MSIQDEVSRHVAKSVVKKMDMDKFADELIPKLHKAIITRILDEVKAITWEDYVHDWMSSDEVNKIMVKRMAKLLK